jgi:hypothetical protein
MVQIIRMEGMEIFASVSFGKGEDSERAMRVFFETQGLQTPKDPGPPGAFDTDLAFSLVYSILPLPSGPQPLAKIVTALFRDLRGADDTSELRFHYCEMTT